MTADQIIEFVLGDAASGRDADHVDRSAEAGG
jgi:hypothetical protein